MNQNNVPHMNVAVLWVPRFSGYDVLSRYLTVDLLVFFGNCYINPPRFIVKHLPQKSLRALYLR